MSSAPRDVGSVDARDDSRRISLGTSPRSPARQITNARLASPVPAEREPVDADNPSQDTAPLAGFSENRQATGPGRSALASALGGNSSRRQTPPPSSPSIPPVVPADTQAVSNYGSFNGTPRPREDFDVIRRHLVSGNTEVSAGEEDNDGSERGAAPSHKEREHSEVSKSRETSTLDDEFSSLQLQGGDVTYEIYRRTEAEASATRAKPQRSQSVILTRDEPAEYENIHQPGGFRRFHVRQNASTVVQSGEEALPVDSDDLPQQNFLTRNFFEFLSLYGHFAGEAVEEDISDDVSMAGSHSVNRYAPPHGDADEDGERAPLLKQTRSFPRPRRERKGPKSGALGTIGILLKSFVGTGVLFLPRAFLNGGMAFSFTVLILVSSVSYYCFLLLTTSRLQVFIIDLEVRLLER